MYFSFAVNILEELCSSKSTTGIRCFFIHFVKINFHLVDLSILRVQAELLARLHDPWNMTSLGGVVKLQGCSSLTFVCIGGTFELVVFGIRQHTQPHICLLHVLL